MSAVVLCSPPELRNPRRGTESLGIRYLAATLRRAGIDCALLDGSCWGMTVDACVAEIIAHKPRILGMQLLFGDQIPSAAAIIARAKAALPSLRAIAGGHVATMSTAECFARLPQLDHIIAGEAEASLLAYAEAERDGAAPERLIATPGLRMRVADGVTANPPPPLAKSLDALAWPARDERDYVQFRHASIISTRGCYARCTFCAVPSFYATAQGASWRLRSAADTVAEMEELHRRWNVDRFSFLDDLWMGTDNRSRERALEFGRLVSERLPGVKYSVAVRADAVDRDIFTALWHSGLEMVFLGIEAGNEQDLAAFNKRVDVAQSIAAITLLREIGIMPTIGFMMFNEATTRDTLRQNIDFLLALEHCFPLYMSSKTKPLPGTAEWARLNAAGKLRGDALLPDYPFRTPDIGAINRTFQTVFRRRGAIEDARHRTAFALSFLHRGSPARRAADAAFREANRNVSRITAEAACQVLDSGAPEDRAMVAALQAQVDRALGEAARAYDAIRDGIDMAAA